MDFPATGAAARQLVAKHNFIDENYEKISATPATTSLFSSPVAASLQIPIRLVTLIRPQVEFLGLQ